MVPPYPQRFLTANFYSATIFLTLSTLGPAGFDRESIGLVRAKMDQAGFDRGTLELVLAEKNIDSTGFDPEGLRFGFWRKKFGLCRDSIPPF